MYSTTEYISHIPKEAYRSICYRDGLGVSCLSRRIMACNSRNSAVVAAHTRMSPEIRERISVVHRSILESITLSVDRQCVQVTAVHHGQIFVEVIPRIDGLCQQDRLAQHALQIVNLVSEWACESLCDWSCIVRRRIAGNRRGIRFCRCNGCVSY